MYIATHIYFMHTFSVKTLTVKFDYYIMIYKDG